VARILAEDLVITDVNMMPRSAFTNRWHGGLALLNRAFVDGDEAAFEATLLAMSRAQDAGAARKLADVMKASGALLESLARFRTSSRLAALAHQGIPDARLRVEHVLTITGEAANRMRDLIERSVPLASASVRSANALMASLDERSHEDIRCFLVEACGNFEAVRANLSEVLLEQGFQDLTGQILRGVRRLIDEVELSLREIARATGGPQAAGVASARGPAPRRR
jgi:chemotaxis protein CheZ